MCVVSLHVGLTCSSDSRVSYRKYTGLIRTESVPVLIEELGHMSQK